MSEMSESLPAEVRRDRIVEKILSSGFARVPDLATAFGVSEVTVRTDLDTLNRTGAVRRVHGGAMPAKRQRERPFERSITEASTEKTAIGQACAAMVESGQSIALDVGSTAAAAARALLLRADLEDVTIVTNSLNIALELESAIPRFTVIVTGGTLRPLQHSMVDPLGTTLLQLLSPDLAFISCNGVDVDRGITNINLPEAQTKQTMVSRSARTVIMADSSKIEQVHLGWVCALSEVDAIVTGPGVSEGFRSRLADTHVDLVETLQ